MALLLQVNICTSCSFSEHFDSLSRASDGLITTISQYCYLAYFPSIASTPSETIIARITEFSPTPYPDTNFPRRSQLGCRRLCHKRRKTLLFLCLLLPSLMLCSS
jgi:hypothetical protein